MQSPQEIKFTKAVCRHARARLGIDCPSGAGKTYTSLVAAQALSGGNPVAVIDIEHGSASLYSDLFPFDVLELDNCDPCLYTRAIKAVEEAGYVVIVIDSLSHAWEGEGGALDQLDKVAKCSYSGSTFSDWKDITPSSVRWWMPCSLLLPTSSLPCAPLLTMSRKRVKKPAATSSARWAWRWSSARASNMNSRSSQIWISNITWLLPKLAVICWMDWSSITPPRISSSSMLIGCAVPHQIQTL